MSCDIILCGVGGQGTILASKLLARSAMNLGLPVKTAETIGMAQRGGSVLSHVRIGEGAACPLIGRGRADLIIAFEPAEAVRQLDYLKPSGTVVTSSRAIVPASCYAGGPAYDYDGIMGWLRERVERLVLVDTEAAAKALGSATVLNVVLLGAAARTGALGMSADDIGRSVRELVPERFHEINARALAWE